MFINQVKEAFMDLIKLLALSGSSETEFVHVLVGDRCFSLAIADLHRFPSSYLTGMIKKEWHSDFSKPFKIARDGSIFRYIADYLFYGIIPNGRNPIDLSVLQMIQAEADFYNLPELVDYCEKFALSGIKLLVTQANSCRSVHCEFDAGGDEIEPSRPTALVNVASVIWSPFCLKGFADPPRHKLLFKNSTPFDVVIPELLKYGRASSDHTTHLCYELDASALIPDTVESIKKRIGQFHLCPRSKLDVRATKLVVYSSGGHCAARTERATQEGQFGTLIYILNTQFTGGEIVVQQKNSIVSISEPREWLALHSDCLLHINPVTSGTLVFLEFAVFNAGLVWLRDCWDLAVGEMHTPQLGHELELRPGVVEGILNALELHLMRVDAVVVALTTLYPILNADPDCLTGGDATLHSILQAAGYEVHMVLVKVIVSVSVPVGVRTGRAGDQSTRSGTGPGSSVYRTEVVEGYSDSSLVEDNHRGTSGDIDIERSNDEKSFVVLPIINSANWVYLHSSVFSKTTEENVYLTSGIRIERALD